MIFIKKTIWLIFCLYPILFVGVLYSLLIGKFAKVELVADFLTAKGIYLNLAGVAYALIFVYLPINFLQLLLTLFLVFANRLKFSKNNFKILSFGLILLLILTVIWLIPYISIAFFRNYQFGEYWSREMSILVYLLDVVVPFGQLFFIYIFWHFWKVWFRKVK